MWHSELKYKKLIESEGADLDPCVHLHPEENWETALRATCDLVELFPKVDLGV